MAIAVVVPPVAVVMPRCRVARCLRRAACPSPSSCHPLPCCHLPPSSCHPLSCCHLPSSFRPSPSSCHVVMSPVTFVVPPVALLPLAVVVPPVAVVVPPVTIVVPAVAIVVPPVTLLTVAVAVPPIAVLPVAVAVPPVAVLPLAVVVPPVANVVPHCRVACRLCHAVSSCRSLPLSSTFHPAAHCRCHVTHCFHRAARRRAAHRRRQPCCPMPVEDCTFQSPFQSHKHVSQDG